MLGKRLVLFILIVAGAFVYIGNAIPQIKSEPVAAEVEIGGSPEELVAAGRRIFTSDRAQCLTCHSLGEDPKARCPSQEGLGERAPRRKPGMGGAEYLVESLYNPNAFVVPGYPKNQMTPVNRPPIVLSHDEILAVICFLNTLGGKTDGDFVTRVKKAQDPWRRGLLKPETGTEEVRLPILPGDVSRGREIFRKQGCIQCHRVGSDGQNTCPDLTAIGGSQGPDYILQSIIEPSAVIVKGYGNTLVLWKDEMRRDLRGTPVAWLPTKDRPKKLKLSIPDFDDDGKSIFVEREVDLDDVAYVGDTTVAIQKDGDIVAICGEYVSGDAKSGVTLNMLEGGRWAERRIPPEIIRNVNLPMSPMPSDFARLLTAREIYDLVAYLVAQKGKK